MLRGVLINKVVIISLIRYVRYKNQKEEESFIAS